MDERYTMYNDSDRKVFAIMLETKMRIAHSRYENYPALKHYDEPINLFLMAANTYTDGIPNNIVIAKSNPRLMDNIYGFLSDYQLIPIVTVSDDIGLYNTDNKSIYAKPTWRE